MAPRRTQLSDSSSTSIVQTQHQHQHQQQIQQQQHQLLQQQQQLPNFQQQQFYQQQQNFINSHNLLMTTTLNMSPMQQTATANGVGGGGGVVGPSMQSLANSNNNSNTNQQNSLEKVTHCSLPQGNCLKLDALIHINDLSDCQRVVCNNENCQIGQYMHRQCFEQWEQSILQALKTNGKARAWTERQRAQNLWTKKGYELVYKLCGCKCGRGHLRKDLEWSAPAAANGKISQKLNQSNGGLVSSNGVTNNNNNNDDDDKKKKKKRNRNQNQQQQQQSSTPTNANQNGTSKNSNATPPTTPPTTANNTQQQQQQQNHEQSNNQQVMTSNSTPNNLSPNPNVGVIGSGLHQNQNQLQQQQQQQQFQQQQSVVASLNNIIGLSNGNILGLDLRNRASSLSSSGSTSPSASHSSGDISISPIHNHHHQHQHHHQQHNQQNLYQQQHLTQSQQLQLQMQQQQQMFNHQFNQQHQQQQQHLQFQSPNQPPPPTAASLLQNGLTKSILSGLNGCVAQNAAATAQQQQQQQHLMNSITATINANAISNGFKSPPPPQTPPTSLSTSSALSIYDQQQLIQQQKYKEVEIYSERVRSTSGCNGIFSRRLDFSSFNLLPKTRLNSYQVKIEDEGNHGNDETRLFILSSLAQSHMSRVACILCEETMLVFDRYPLVDGSFFLSPKQHSPGCIEVKYEGRTLYLTCVCMGCLDGISSHRAISCRFCGEFWDGSNLVLGTMYAYDIFAAMPCCAERLKCNNCFKLLLYPQQRLNFFSDYSHCVTCPYCTTQDTHFVKPLNFCYTKGSTGRQQQLA